MNETESVFAGLRVLDVGSFIASPAAATVLSDFGAQVIKIEPPGSGDPYRALANQPGYPQSPHNYCWSLDGRNKRSLALNLAGSEGQEVLHRLVQTADVFVTNAPLASRDRLGIDHQQLAKLNGRLIYASFTAYGEVGDEAHLTGFDSTAWWGRSGLMDHVRPDSQSPPARSAPGMGDHQSALSLFGAIVTALYRRERTGTGAYVGSSLIANGAWSNSCLLQAALCGANFSEKPPRTEAKIPLSNHYRCRDGRWIILSMSVSPVQEERSWPAFAQAISHPDWVEDPRFATRSARMKNHEQLVSALDDAFGIRDARDWRDALAAIGVSVGIVARAEDLVDDRQMLATGVFVPLPGGDGAELTVSSPFWLAESAKVTARPAPSVGQHTDEVLRELGFDFPHIELLRAAGTVA
ncbi:CaiB/BaiF CoA transferase family protein [Lacisediminimonas profundi]|uniref:CaiB/BaiF CoA transferase family protein n=1 Tax=Lacisediminimonas profundi TaxID=2603856 RepID=UPI00124BB083|nr:CoA transferase [Lacisediminimonas profundi]